MTTRYTVLRTHNVHRDYSKSSPNQIKQFNVADGFVLDRGVDGSFRVSHPKATKVVGIGPSEVLDWEEETFMPGLAKTEDKRSRDKVA
jgi:hypothetical protein